VDQENTIRRMDRWCQIDGGTINYNNEFLIISEISLMGECFPIFELEGNCFVRISLQILVLSLEFRYLLVEKDI